MNLRFTKMQGLGNDFAVIDAINQSFEPTVTLVRRLSDRHFGIGFDQLLLVNSAQIVHADFRYRVFNSDGQEVEQCGNGARCLARFLIEKGLTTKTHIVLETLSGILCLQAMPNGEITVDMGIPHFLPEEIPFLAKATQLSYPLEVEGMSYDISVASMGNPHAVYIVTDIASAPVAELGPKIEYHPRFPERVNVSFMQILSRDAISLRVFERAAGETLACGSGACASAVTGIRRGQLDHQVQVHMAGGTLTIQWEGEGKPVLMTGPATTVFEGNIKL